MRHLVLLLCLAVGCATTRTASAPAASEPAVDLDALRARELAPLPRHKLSPPGGAFSGEVEGSAAPTFERSEGTTSVTVALGEASNLMCFVYDNPIDAGGALQTVVQAIAESPEMTVQRVHLTDILESAGVPAVFLDVDYVTPGEGGLLAGQTKLMVRVSNALPVLCAHDQPGYTQSFRRISLGLATSLAVPGQAPEAPARFEQLHVARLGSTPVGFEWWVVREGADGRRMAESTHLAMMPGSPTQLKVSDSSSTFTTDASGQLELMSYARASDGQLRAQVTLSREAPGSYRYEGTHEGRPVEGTLQSKRGLVHALATAPLLRERLLSGAVRELAFDFYQPASDPTKPTEVVYRKAGAGPRAVSMDMAGLSVTGTLDARGLMERADMPLSGSSAKVTLERVFARGEP